MSEKRPFSTNPDFLDLLLVHGLTLFVVLLILMSGGCGTGCGNPGCEAGASGAGIPFNSPDSEDVVMLNFDLPIAEYQNSTAEVDCGSYSHASTYGEVLAGRQCIRENLEKCLSARYLLNQYNANSSRFVSFVAVEEDQAEGCQLHVHTVSSDPNQVLGDLEATCTELGLDEIPELACGIADL